MVGEEKRRGGVRKLENPVLFFAFSFVQKERASMLLARVYMEDLPVEEESKKRPLQCS